MQTYIYIYIYNWVCVSLSLSLHIWLSIYPSIYLSLSLYLYIYIYICIHIAQNRINLRTVQFLFSRNGQRVIIVETCGDDESARKLRRQVTKSWLGKCPSLTCPLGPQDKRELEYRIPNVYIYIYMYTSLPLALSLSLYIYIYIYMHIYIYTLPQVAFSRKLPEVCGDFRRSL